MTHNYKRADDYHCYECPKDCVDCAFESVSGSVNCSDCSADENRDITVVSNYAAHTEYD